ncbi:MAG TPA: NAD(P)H-dependent oxidoreductase [Flavipsychrobacter sp.]|nr:NAD(P)H-dependent oxidoreductase [Flavipsychrobacter sp.]
MITVISGTNRKDSMTIKVAELYHRQLSEKLPDVSLFSLEGKSICERNEELKRLEQQYLIPAEKFVFIMPEYNGSFPGILKLLMDNSDIKKCWWYKKAMLVGVADGRGGNSRGIDHMTNILHYLKVHVLHNKLPLSRINEEISDEGILLKDRTALAINDQIDDFLKF